MELSGRDIDVLSEFFGTERLQKLTIRGSFARGYLAISRDIEMIMEFYYPPDFGSVLAAMKFALKGILKLKIDIVTINGVEKSLSVFLNNSRVLIFEE